MKTKSDPSSETFRFGHLLCAPIVHSRMYFALWVQELVEAFRPELIAVEFPQALKALIVQGVERLPFLSAVCSSPDGDTYSYVPIDPCDGLIHAVRLGIENRIPVHFVDLNRVDLNDRSLHYTPDDYVLPKIGPEAYYKMTMEKTPLSADGSVARQREQHMAARLRSILSFERRTLFVCGMIHWERVRAMLKDGGGFEYFDLEAPDRESFLANLHPESAQDTLEEIPAVAGRFETARRVGKIDRNDEVARLIERASVKSKIDLAPAVRKNLAKYLRNLSHVSLQFTPDIVDLLTAAKNICGNEFAFHLMEIAQKYPYFRDEEDMPVIRIVRTFEESDEGRLGLKTIKLRRRGDMAWKRNMKRVKLKRRPGERFKGEWRATWDLAAEHCSFPPEDILLEDYNQFIRNKIRKMLSEEKTRVTEFKTSLMDGVDMRETIRNWHKEKIYVRDVPFIRGKVGPVAFVFDEKRPERYPWRTVWYSEHKNESDLIMYTTTPGDALVGPGISQCRFGGFASIFPPRRIMNLWFYFDRLRMEGLASNEADLMLYAAILYAEEKYVGYVAPSPPSWRLKRFAGENGKQVVYVPLSALSPDSVSKLQRFHVLGAKRLRSIAHKYIL